MRFTIKLKLALAFAFLLTLLLGTAAYGILSLSGLNDTMEATVKGPVARLELVQNINIDQLQNIRQQKNMLGAANAAEVDSARKKGDVARAHLKEALDAALSIASEQGRRRWLKIQELAAKADAADDRIRAFVASGAIAEAQKLSVTEAREAANELDSAVEELITLSKQQLDEANASADATYQTTSTIMIGPSRFCASRISLTALPMAAIRLAMVKNAMKK